MKTKILIGLIVLIALSAGGYFIWKNVFVPEDKKEEAPAKRALF